MFCFFEGWKCFFSSGVNNRPSGTDRSGRQVWKQFLAKNGISVSCGPFADCCKDGNWRIKRCFYTLKLSFPSKDHNSVYQNPAITHNSLQSHPRNAICPHTRTATVLPNLAFTVPENQFSKDSTAWFHAAITQLNETIDEIAKSSTKTCSGEGYFAIIHTRNRETAKRKQRIT